MSEITRVALDAMGGDNAPVETVKGAVQAVQQRKDIQILLTGREDVIKSELAKYKYPGEQIRILSAESISSGPSPRLPKGVIGCQSGNVNAYKKWLSLCRSSRITKLSFISIR